jgi:hypothetical protein
MSEIKSPFLDDGEKINNEYGRQPVASEMETGGGNNNATAETGVGVRPKSVIDSGGDVAIPEVNSDVASLEIKEDGKVLRNFIITMIILLVLSLLGLVMYNLLNKSGEVSESKVLKEETSVEINNFEMKGEKFKAGSIIIEQ